MAIPTSEHDNAAEARVGEGVPTAASTGGRTRRCPSGARGLPASLHRMVAEICLLIRHICCMTASQFARAIRADPKWVQNAARILGKRFRYSTAEARWLGLVHQLQQHFGIPLRTAGDMATTALAAPATEQAVSVGESGDGSARIVIDVARYDSSFAASRSWWSVASRRLHTAPRT